MSGEPTNQKLNLHPGDALVALDADELQLDILVEEGGGHRETHSPTGAMAHAALPGGAWSRLPGLYRRWESFRVVMPGAAVRIEPAGTSAEGLELFSVYICVGAQDSAQDAA